MFAIKIRQLYFISDKIGLRTLRTRLRRLDISGPNPGLDRRVKAFKKDGIKIQDDEVEEFVEQSESNIYAVGEAYNEHLNETLIGKYELRHHIVKEKYFKENMPNLLTWSEKEQIRHLANTQPEEWTPERLAESFPVTDKVVKKLLKYPWKPASEERIARHDASAMRNWRELKEGTLDIPEELRQHFLKFSDRTIPPLNKKSMKIDLTRQQKIGEFESIIKRCAEKENENHYKKENLKVETNETTTKNVTKDYKKITLDELATKIKDRLHEGQMIDATDKIMVDSISSSNQDNYQSPTPDIDLIEYTKPKNRLTEFKENDNKMFSGLNYPERIRIPKKAYKKSATYKINDCFYDHDGRFLYRVMGLTEN